MSGACTATLLTPGGVGAIAVVRVQGRDALSIVLAQFRPIGGELELNCLPIESLHYGTILENDEVLDDVILACRKNPDVIDICFHGGRRIIERVFLLLETRGVVLSKQEQGGGDPFSSLAARARTRRAVRFLAAQRNHAPDVLQALSNHESSPRNVNSVRYQAARILVDGAHIVVVGPTNAGKSTLVNRLSGEERVLVSDQSGTTRDWTTHEIALGGVPIHLTDTAGLHAGSDTLESEAISRGQKQLRGADLVLSVRDSIVDVSEPFTGGLGDDSEPTCPILHVLNKVDLYSQDELSNMAPSVVCLSAETGYGVNLLSKQILETLGLENPEWDLSPEFFD